MSGEKRYIILIGGRGSGKSWEAANIFIDKCLRDKHRRVLACRKIRKDTKGSVLKQTTDVLASLGIGNRVRVNEHEGIIKFDNGAQIITAGLDDPNKVKSYSGITDVWFEEAFDTTYRDWETLDLGMRGEHAEDATFMLTLNPLSWRNWIYEHFFQRTDPDAYTLSTSYRDNPLAGETYGRIIEKITDPQSRKVLVDGEWGEDIKGLIYPDWTEVDELPNAGRHIFGLDFGYNDPMVLMELRLVDQKDLFVHERLYKSEMTTSDLIAWMKAEKIPRNVVIVADSQDPHRIEEIRRAGFNIHPCIKGPGSVVAGISKVKGLNLHITRTSTNARMESRFYKWAVDKDDRPLDQPIDEMDHAMDAIRYPVDRLVKGPTSSGAVSIIRGSTKRRSPFVRTR